VRVMTIERGVDPRAYTLMPFGGAGPLHATAIAAELGIDRILCPRASGVLSAVGLAAAAPRRDGASSHGGASVAELRARVRAELGTVEPARERFTYELRYRGQSFELGVVAGPDATLTELGAAFTAEHDRRYGYVEPDGEVELVTVRATAWGPEPLVGLSSPPGTATRAACRAIFDGAELDTDLLVGEPVTGTLVEGPAIWALPSSTLVVAPGWSGAVDDAGTIVLERRT
jgi:N-methylhydantoinase A